MYIRRLIMEINNIIFAFLLTLFAGLSTGIGSALAFFAKKTNEKFLSAALGFSAGVMIYVSMIEIFPKAKESLSVVVGDKAGLLYTTIAFFIGMGIIALIDKLVPNYENPHEVRDVNDMEKSIENKNEYDGESKENGELMRMGLFSALAIAIHNFPEGLATFMSAIEDPALGISIAVAIAIHNIPEGIAVSVPIYYATGCKKKAFKYSFLSGLSEPLGALLGYFLLRQLFNELMFGLIFAGVGGIMVYIALDELLPTAERYGEHHVAIMGVISGMIIMAVSIILFA